MKKEKEKWEKLVFRGIPTYYLVSSHGRMTSIERVVADENLLGSKKNKVIKRKVLKPSKTKGYLYYKIQVNNKSYSVLASRMTAYYFVDNPNHKKEVHHIDYDKKNNYYKNLRWVTRSENMKDAFEKGVMNICRPETHPNCKKVGCYKDGKLVKTYISTAETEKDGFIPSLISRAIKTSFNHKGYKWKFVDKQAA